MPNKMPTDIDHRNQLVHDLIYAEPVHLILKPAGQAIWTMELPLGVGIEGADDIKLDPKAADLIISLYSLAKKGSLQDPVLMRQLHALLVVIPSCDSVTLLHMAILTLQELTNAIQEPVGSGLFSATVMMLLRLALLLRYRIRESSGSKMTSSIDDIITHLDDYMSSDKCLRNRVFYTIHRASLTTESTAAKEEEQFTKALMQELKEKFGTKLIQYSDKTLLTDAKSSWVVVIETTRPHAITLVAKSSFRVSKNPDFMHMGMVPLLQTVDGASLPTMEFVNAFNHPNPLRWWFDFVFAHAPVAEDVLNLMQLLHNGTSFEDILLELDRDFLV
jgi:hypothetical protein